MTTYEIGVSDEVTKETVTTNGVTVSRDFEYNTLGQNIAITTKHDGDPVGHRVLQTYDAAGNLTHTATGTTYTYNIYNQPVTETHPDNSSVNHTYWVTGQRQTTTTTSSGPAPAETSTVTLHWDGATLINDTHITTNDSNPNSNNDTSKTNPNNINSSTKGSVTGSYLIGASRHTRNLTTNADTHGGTGGGAGGTTYYVTDRHGNTTAMTNSTGAITAAYEYTDYGVTTEHTSPGQNTTAGQRNPFLYAAEYTTPDGRQYLNLRTYDPAVFGFTTQDTADQFNVYSYANSNPIIFVDPTGQNGVRDTIISAVGLGIGVIFLAFAGAAIGAAALTHAWISVGIGILGAATDTAATTIAAAQLINEHADGYEFIKDERDTEILAQASLGLSIAGGLLGIGTAIGAALKNAARHAAHRAAQQVAAAERVAVQQAWEESVLLKDAAGTPIAHELTNLSGSQRVQAIRNLLTRIQNDPSGKGIQFVFVREPNQPLRVGLGRFTLSDRATGTIGGFDFGTVPDGSDHEGLLKLMGVNVPVRLKAPLGVNVYTTAGRTHVSGGQFTQPYRNKASTGFRVRAYPASGHFAADAPGTFWSPQVSAAFENFMRADGFEVRYHIRARATPAALIKADQLAQTRQ